MKSAKDLAEASGLTVHKSRNLLAGRWAPELTDAEAVEHALGVDRHVLSLALCCEQLADSRPGLREEDRFHRPHGPSREWPYKRRKDGSLYRGKLKLLSDAAAALSKRGGEWERVAEAARQHALAPPNRSCDWLAPYRRMVELERERLRERGAAA